MSDLIDRQKTLEEIYQLPIIDRDAYEFYRDVRESIKSMPSAEPKMRMTQDQIDNIRERMCDNYCKWQGMPVQRVLYDICNECPLNELEASE